MIFWAVYIAVVFVISIVQLNLVARHSRWGSYSRVICLVVLIVFTAYWLIRLKAIGGSEPPGSSAPMFGEAMSVVIWVPISIAGIGLFLTFDFIGRMIEWSRMKKNLTGR